MLAREGLRERLRDPNLDRRLVITPLLDRRQIGPASIDLRLGSEFLLLKKVTGAGIDPGGATEPGADEHVVVPLGEALWLHPQQFVLGSTLEFLRLPTDLGAYVLGRSS